MTVCIAALFKWIYGDGSSGWAAVTASDRTITVGDIEYEPNQMKVAFLTKKVIAMIAGEYPVHSEAIQRTKQQIEKVPEENPAVIAEIYASFLREIKYRAAVQTFLTPLGLDHESFHAGMHDMPTEFVEARVSQLQNFRGPDTEAIIVGADEHLAHIYLVDLESKVSCHDDVGFVAIGGGAWHAKSVFTSFRYANTWEYAASLPLIYAAKKRAEVAPGVGSVTDMLVITRDGWHHVLPELRETVEKLYKEYDERRKNEVLEFAKAINLRIEEIREAQKLKTDQQSPQGTTGGRSLPPPSQEKS